MQPFWKNKNVFVTGANGFVGTWLTSSLYQKGANVVALIRDFNPENVLFPKEVLRKIHVVQGNLEDFSLLERAINEHEIDTVFHLGAQTLVETAIRSPFQTFESNIRGTYNLLESCRQHLRMVRRILIASSDKAYGNNPLPYTEDTPLRGKVPYDVSKSCTDLISASYSHTYQLPVVIARCGNLYGGGDLNWNRIVPGTVRSLLNGDPPLIRSNGKLTRDYLYVQDAIEAYLLMAMKADQPNVCGQAFNFGPSHPLSAIEMVEMIQTIMNVEKIKPIILNRASKEIPDQSLDSSKARRFLGWSPQFSLVEGLKKTVSWYENYLQSDRCVSQK